MSEKINEINYLDSFAADTLIVREVIDSLICDLHKMNYPKEESDEIILAMDEIITNAVQETLFSRKDEPNRNNPGHEITVRYHISHYDFDATIIDHGKGLDIDAMFKKVPDSKAPDYKEQLFKYAQKADGKKLRIRINGKEITINGIGAGLKIILSFMDTLNIDLIDRESVISNSVAGTTDGSIITMHRKRRY
jgi:anti-sigma regulatory factor (Ser/Thr protein kinase)